MKITFLGTRGEVEEKERTHRYQTGLLVEGKEAKILFDCGEERFLAEKPEAIFLTHAHPDHVKGLKKGTDLPVYLTRETEEGIRKFGLENRTRLEPGKETTFKGIKITPYRVLHSLKAPAVLFRVSEDDFTFIFAPDVLSIPDREEVLEGVDLYIGDGSSLTRNLVRRKDSKIFGHASVKTQIGWLHKAGIRNVIFAHWGSEAIKLHGRTLKLRIRQLAEPDLKAAVAKDGMKIDSRDYESLKAGSRLDGFKGNIVTKEEREYRLEELRKTITAGKLAGEPIDEKVVPYIEKINEFPFIVTTQSCWGHKGSKGRKAHFDFRSGLSEADTIDFLLRPMQDKFEGVSTELMLENERLRYCLWLDNEEWEEEFKYFIKLLRGAERRSRARRRREAELLEAVLPYKPKIEKKIDLIRTRDDWRIFGGWYAQLKERGKFKYSKDEILNKFLIPCLKELIREGSTEFHPENWKKHPREIYLEAFDKIVKKFRYLVKPHGTMIWEGKKTATVHARRFIQGAFFSIVEGDKEFGFARFEAGRKIDLKEFTKLRDQHRVSEDERKDWWPEARVLYFYKIRTWVPFEKPRIVKVPRGIRTYGARADLKEAAEGVGEAKYRRDRCMRCDKSPEYEILWAEGMARAWFCEEHLKRWLGEGPDRFSQDLSAVKRVVNGQAAKKWKDNPNPDIRDRLKKILEGSTCAPAMQKQKINSPTFAYMAVYGKEPEDWIPGRTGGPEKEWRNGIMIDEHLKSEWFDALNNIAGIEIRASCEGHSPERVSYIVFRMRDSRNDGKAEALAEKLNAEDGIYSKSDIGAEGRPRICVAGKTYYGQPDWERWWNSLAEKVGKKVEGVLKEGFAAEIFDPKDYEPAKLKELSDEELLKKRKELIELFEQRGAKAGDELVVNAYQFVREEIERRGLGVEFTGKLGELTAGLREKRKVGEETDRDVMLKIYNELEAESLSEDEIITRIAKNFLSIGFDLEYWKEKVKDVLKREGKLKEKKGESAKLGEGALDEYLLEQGKKIQELGQIVWKPNFTSVTGSVTFVEDRLPNDLDTVFRTNEVDDGLLLKVDRIFEKYYGSGCHPIPGPYGPNWRHLPIWDLALVPTKELRFIEINEPGFIKEFYEAVRLAGAVPRAASEELRKQAADSIREDKIKMNRFFLGLKPTRPAFPEERMTLDSLLKFFKPEDFPVFVEKKYD